MHRPASTIFEVFNARDLQPWQVAKTFIPPEYFHKIRSQAHTMLVGPRGSGKTTLLKMLHPSALDRWENPEADAICDGISFVGVYIPTDKTWIEQVNGLGNGRLDIDSHRAITQAAITYHILQCLTTSMLYRTGRVRHADDAPPRRSILRVDFTRDQEADTCRSIAQAWSLDLSVPTFEGLLVAIVLKANDISQIAYKVGHESIDARPKFLAGCSSLHLDFIQAVSTGISIFNVNAREHDRRWCLLCDELELAPNWYRQRLLHAPRSVDDKLIFKLALSPYGSDIDSSRNSALAPQPGHDYVSVALWYTNKQDGFPFCRRLLQAMLAKRLVHERSADDVLGASVTDRPKPGEEGYGKGSNHLKLLKDLAGKDKSFAAYLKRKEVNLQEPDQITPEQRDQVLRKVITIAALRNTYLKSSGLRGDEGMKARSRKRISEYYSGAESLFALVEGNPRLFIGLMGQILSGVSDAEPTVSKSRQLLCVENTCNMFKAMLRTMPCPPVRVSSRGLLSLINAIGRYFQNQVLAEKFDPEPCIAVTVHTDVSDEVAEALGRAVDAGALIYIPDKEDEGVSLRNLRGKSFRLAYLLAPSYCLPLQVGRSVSLKRILETEGPALRGHERTIQQDMLADI